MTCAFMGSNRRWWCGAIVAAAGIGAISGCSSGIKVAPEAYRGPPIGSDTENGFHMVVAELPSPGWALEIDATRESADLTDVFVTLRRPNPAAVYPQQIVTQRAVTRVDEQERLGIVARVVDYSETEDPAYRRVR